MQLRGERAGQVVSRYVVKRTKRSAYRTQPRGARKQDQVPIFFLGENLDSVHDASGSEEGVGLIGRFVAFRPKGRGFESHSSRHVGTLGKSFTCHCL